MIKRTLIAQVLILFTLLQVNGQVKKQDKGLKREVTLYNPYKPSLPESRKISFLPDINDTSKVKPVFHYKVNATPFLPEYTISPIKAAALLPDPLPKLYKSYINLGMGNWLSPLAELSISNERSKKGAIGFYARHFSTNGNIEIENGKKAFAGYMDNDVSLFGRKFFRNNVLGSSLDYSEKSRYAYGYDPSFKDYSPSKKDIRIPYNNLSAKVSLSSLTLDSTDFSYDFNISYNYFFDAKNFYQRNFGIAGTMAKLYKGFYIGAGLNYDYYRLSELILAAPEYIASISPFIKKSSEQWIFKLGFEALIDKNMTSSAQVHVYPDVNFSLNIVPSYISFFTGLSGKLDKNEPVKVISENPFLARDGSLYKLPNTSHDFVINAGLRGNTGLGGNYMVSASYSMISNMLFYSNLVSPDTVIPPNRGNYFSALTDNVEVLNLHAEMSGRITDKLSLCGMANLYKYSLSKYEFAWNRPGWDGKLTLKYNLREKIIAGMEITALGKRHEIVNGDISVPDQNPGNTINPNHRVISEMPAHFNLNLSAEYRYSKILSIWTKLNNISGNHYYEWVYYPSQRFLFMLGFTYNF